MTRRWWLIAASGLALALAGCASDPPAQETTEGRLPPPEAAGPGDAGAEARETTPPAEDKSDGAAHPSQRDAAAGDEDAPDPAQALEVVAVGEPRALAGDAGYSHFIVGEVENVGTKTARVTVDLTLYDDGVLAASAGDATMLDVVHPGERVPYKLWLEEEPPRLLEYRLTVTAEDAYPFWSELRAFDTTDVVTRESEWGGMRFLGEVTNTGDEVSHETYAVVALYDDEGIVDAFGASTSPARLEPGATASFQATSLHAAPEYDSLRVLVEGR